jgi:hypothetical protein
VTTAATWHGGLIGTEEGINGSIHVDRNVKAVMLADGKWYTVEDPTLPDGPDGYLSFLQHLGNATTMINVSMRDIKAVAYFHMPMPGFEGLGRTT